jgi:RNA polymerase II-associated protein 2
VYTSRLVAKPPQLVPSLEDVFGTDRPNPFEWEKQQLALQADAKGDGAVAPHRRNHTRRRTQEAKTVWSKTSDLGVVERPTATDPSQLLASLAAATPAAISENVAPAAPASNFPDASQAVVIEGFVFPSHKQSLAKKVERKWQDTAKTRGDEIIVSDSEESDVGDDEDDASSTSSVDESDYDPDDVEGEIISTDDLPPFINLWRILSEWITHDTTLLVANKPLSVKPAPAPPRNAQEKKDREQAERAAQLTFNDRYNALSLMLGRPLPHVAQQLPLPYDRYASHRIDSLLKTFELRDAIDGRHSQQVRGGNKAAP